MRYNVNTNQIKCLEYGINLKESALMELFNQLSSWADDVKINSERYYFISRHVVVKELPVFFKTADTVYRYFRTLDKKGMIVYYNDKSGKDYVRLTAKGKQWNALGKKSDSSEKNPTYLGKKSEPLTKSEIGLNDTLAPINADNSGDFENVKGSEKNPTYNSIYIKRERDQYAPASENAFSFFKNNNPARLETWLMQHKSQIKDFKKFEADFNDTFDIEQLPYESDVILKRLNKYARNWIANQDRFNKPQTEELVPPYLKNKFE